MIATAFGIAIALLVAWYLIRASIRVALVVLVATSFVLPGTVLVPGSFSAHTTLHRIVLGIFILNLLRKVAFGQIPASVLRPSGVTVALAAWVVLSFAIGVAFADQNLSLSFSTFLWIFILDYAVFFYFVLAGIRAIGDPWWFARVLVVLIVVNAGMAVYEHFTGDSVARRLAQLIRRRGYVGVNRLGTRGGDPRPQAGFDFPLAFAWAATALLPLVVVVATRAKRTVARFAPALVVLAIGWTYTRSAFAGLAIAAVLLPITTRLDRKVAAFVLVGAVVAAGFVLVTPVISKTFGTEEVQASSQVRQERLPLVLSEVTDHPFFGRGLSSVTADVRTTDSSFLLTYAELGVVGVAGLTLLFLVSACLIAPAMRAPPPDRLLGGAALCGLILAVFSAAFLDTFTASGSTRALWAAVALGVLVCERAGVGWRFAPPRRLLVRIWVPVAGVVAGFVLIAATAPSTTATVRFTTRDTTFEAVSTAPTGFIGTLLVNTTCEIVRARVAAAGYRASCYDLRSSVGVGDIRIEAPTAAALERITRVVILVVRRALRSPRFFLLELEDGVRPTYVRTAPAWLGIAGAAAAWLTPPLPPLRRRRRESAFMSATPAAAGG